MENQIKVGTVVTFVKQGVSNYPIDFVVSDVDGDLCYLRFYSHVTGVFEIFPGWVPKDSLTVR